MIQTTYISCAAEPPSTEELLALLQQCLKNNAESGVTGMLLYGNETYLQVLEGEENAIDRLVAKIEKDPRHIGIHVLHRKSIEHRQYAGWSMGFKRISDRELHNIEGLRNFGQSDFNSKYLIEHDAAVETLLDHYRTPYWDPLLRELDQKDKLIESLNKQLAEERGRIEIAGLVLESVIDAGRHRSLTEGHFQLCASALSTLMQSEDIPSLPR